MLVRSSMGFLEHVRLNLVDASRFSHLYISNSGVFLCIRCSGIHRGMGTHISKVKSVDLDMWTPEQMEVLVQSRVSSGYALILVVLSSLFRNGGTDGRISTGRRI
jgi:hypothetical protein